MSYEVFARKYRPKSFDEVVGQEHVIRPLVNALRSGRTAHAYLFAGSRGVGKTTAARLLAMALTCPAEDVERPCGNCDSCRDILRGQAVDVYEMDGASNRGINEIRELRETVRYMPAKGRRKVYVIDEVHMLTKEAFNALLKTLEEPPEHVVFIFATTEAHKVLPTILSRCQRYDFKRISVADISGRLREIADLENIEISDMSLRLLARESEGGMRDALSLFDQVRAYAGEKIDDADVPRALGLIDRAMIADMARLLLAGDAGGALDTLDQAYNNGFDTKEFAVRLLDYFRSLVVVKVSREPQNILDLMEDELADVAALAEECSLETLNFHFNAWLEAQGRLNRSLHPRLVMESLIVRLAQVEPVTPLAEIAARLEALLGGAGSSGPRGGGRPGPAGAPPGGGTDRGGSPAKGGADAAAAGGADVPPAGEPDRGGDWTAFVAAAKEAAPIKFSALDNARPRAFGPDRVEIVFGARSEMGLVDRGGLEPLLREFFGRKPEVAVVVEENGGAPPPPAEDRDRMRNEMLNHPNIKEITEMLPGRVLDVIMEEK